ncbi:phage protein [Streptococcus mitis]|uniref:Phage protein n=1 Tax=Streptococcus mitis TaxID=28037 RepID=A0A4U9XZV4_STRMT|nr:YopX family protein [Streptococcus mitis]VTS18856.1 phage protein [Streptococcus mitis]
MILKFRAWHKTWEEMGRITFIRYKKSGEIAHLSFRGNTYSGLVKLDEIELMQSTDMVDRNGKIIFGGDIVRMAKDVYSEPTYYEVVRHRGGAYRLESKQHGCELWLRHTDCEVAGNVYENPELLEDKE